MMFESMKGVFASMGEAFQFYKEHFSKIMLIGLTILFPFGFFLLIVDQFSYIYPQMSSLYPMVLPVVFSIGQLPLIYISLMFINDEIFETGDMFRFFFKKLSTAYTTSLVFFALVAALEFISDYLWIIGVFLSISIPYLVILKEYEPIVCITKSVKMGLVKWMQLLILLASFYLIGLGIKSGLFMGIELLTKGTAPDVFLVMVQLVIEISLIPFAVFVLTKCYYKWLEKE
ncbi:hypothetical protein ACFQ4J_12360 [Laceyella tengchongensis]|jgi:hypothetical protein